MKLFTVDEFLQLPPNVLFALPNENKEGLLLCLKGDSDLEAKTFQFSTLVLPEASSDPEADTSIGIENAVMDTRSALDTPVHFWVVDPADFQTLGRIHDQASGIYHRSDKYKWKLVRTPEGNLHVDEFIDRSPYFFDETDEVAKGLKYAHFRLISMRYPAAYMAAYRPYLKDLPLFVDFEGKTWKVTGASRHGDIHLSDNMGAAEGAGYTRRVMMNLATMTGWRSTAINPDADPVLSEEEMVKPTTAPERVSRAIGELPEDLTEEERYNEVWMALRLNLNEEQQTFLRNNGGHLWTLPNQTAHEGGPAAYYFVAFDAPSGGLDPKVQLLQRWFGLFPEWADKKVEVLSTDTAHGGGRFGVLLNPMAVSEPPIWAAS